MPNPVVIPAIRIDVDGDKALRLECLRLAWGARSMVEGEDPTADILSRANRYAAFVLDYAADEVTDAGVIGDVARG